MVTGHVQNKLNNKVIMFLLRDLQILVSQSFNLASMQLGKIQKKTYKVQDIFLSYHVHQHPHPQETALPTQARHNRRRRSPIPSEPPEGIILKDESTKKSPYIPNLLVNEVSKLHNIPAYGRTLNISKCVDSSNDTTTLYKYPLGVKSSASLVLS